MVERHGVGEVAAGVDDFKSSIVSPGLLPMILPRRYRGVLASRSAGLLSAAVKPTVPDGAAPDFRFCRRVRGGGFADASDASGPPHPYSASTITLIATGCRSAKQTPGSSADISLAFALSFEARRSTLRTAAIEYRVPRTVGTAPSPLRGVDASCVRRTAPGRGCFGRLGSRGGRLQRIS